MGTAHFSLRPCCSRVSSTAACLTLRPCRLVVIAVCPSNISLPDVHPGALPQLQKLEIHFERVQGTLPASWGRPDVLPQLRQLMLGARFDGPLPAEWQRGLRVLEELAIAGGARNNTCTWKYAPKSGREEPWQRPAWAAAAASRVTGRSLPAQWASGFPNLKGMYLEMSGVSGPIPPTWLEGGFASLESL